MVENEDVVLTRLSLSTEIITRYDLPKSIPNMSKFCLPFFLKNDLIYEEKVQLEKDDARTMLNSLVVMLSTDEQNDDKMQSVPVPINNITVEHPQTIFLAMRMFPKGQQFHTYSRIYLDSIIDQRCLLQILNVHPTPLDKSDIISYLSSIFLMLQNNSLVDRDIEELFRSQELEIFVCQTSLEPSKKWGSIHSRRLSRVLFTICLFLSPILPFDLLSPECAKLFEPVKKEKINALFYFFYKRDIWFALQTVTNGSISETFSLACACAGISPFILLQICFSLAPIKEGRFLERKVTISNTPLQCLNIPEIQDSTKAMVNLISLRFNNLLQPKPDNNSFFMDLQLLCRLGFKSLDEQATDLTSAMQNFFGLKQSPPFSGDSAPPLTPFPRLSKTTSEFACDIENPAFVQFAAFKAHINSNNFNYSIQCPTSAHSNNFEHSQLGKEESSFNGLNFNNLNNSSVNCFSSTSTITRGNNLFSQSLPFQNSITQPLNASIINSTAYGLENLTSKNASTLQNPNNGLIFNPCPISSPYIPQPQSSSSTSPLEILKNAQEKSFLTKTNEFFNMKNFQNFESSSLFQNSPSSSSSSSTSPLGNNLLANAAQSILFNTNNFQLSGILTSKPSTSFSSLINNSTNTAPFRTSEPFFNKSNDTVISTNFSLNKNLNCTSSSSISPSKYNATSLLIKNNDNKINYGSNFNSYHNPAIFNAISSPNNNTSKTGPSRNSLNYSADNLSTNCNSFKLNHLIRIAPSTKDLTLSNQGVENLGRLNSEISTTNDSTAIPSDSSKTVTLFSSFEKKGMKESQAKTTLLLPVKESCHLNVIEEVIETVTSFSTFNKKRLEESQDKTLKLPVKESCHLNVIKELNSTSLIVEPGANSDKNESTDNVPVNANSEKWKTKSKKLLVMKDNFDNGLKENEKAKAETIFEESEEAQDFELLIETSFEPLIDDLTSISIVEEELIDKHESEDELVDPDDCPVKCICGFNHLEQQTIFCEKCRIWKHIKCLKAEKYANSEDEYCCPECQGKILPLSPSEAQDLVSKSMKLEHLDFKTKQCQELKLSGALQLEWKAISEDSAEYKSSKVGKLIHEGKMRWAVLKKGQAGRLLAGFRIKLGDPVIGVNGIASYMADAKNYCTCYRNLNLSFLPEPIIIEMKGRNAGLAHEILPSCHPNCEIKFCVYKNNLYSYLVALSEIDNDDELTIAFPDTDYLHVSCAESSSDCIETCPSQKSTRTIKNKKAVSQNEPPSKKLKRF